jgi:hypothetical protein
MMAFLRAGCCAPTSDWVDNALVVEVLAPTDGKAIHPKVWLRVEIAVHT